MPETTVSEYRNPAWSNLYEKVWPSKERRMRLNLVDPEDALKPDAHCPFEPSSLSPDGRHDTPARRSVESVHPLSLTIVCRPVASRGERSPAVKRPKRPSPERAFGLVLRSRRMRAGVSQERLAELADLHRTYVSQIERGMKSPSLRVIIAIAAALGVPAHILLKEVEQLSGGDGA